MKKKFLLCFSALIFYFSMTASALSVAFQVLQRDGEDRPVRQATYQIEDALFDCFFSRGIIASNSPAAVSSDADSDIYLFQISQKEARDGGVTYFINVLEKFADSVESSSALLGNLECIEWSVHNIRTGKEIGRGKSIPPVAADIRKKDKALADYAFELADDICSSIER